MKKILFLALFCLLHTIQLIGSDIKGSLFIDDKQTFAILQPKDWLFKAAANEEGKDFYVFKQPDNKGNIIITPQLAAKGKPCQDKILTKALKEVLSSSQTAQIIDILNLRLSNNSTLKTFVVGPHTTSNGLIINYLVTNKTIKNTSQIFIASAQVEYLEEMIPLFERMIDSYCLINKER